MKCPACAETIQNDVETCPFCDTNVLEFELPVKKRRRASAAAGAEKPVQKSRWWIWLLVAGGVGVLMMSGCLFAVLLPAISQSREAARRVQCQNNLKQIALALHNYHHTHGRFPPAVTYGANGQPMHSWRVLLLPFLDQVALSREYNMNEPWNGPNNSRLLDRMPPQYACPSSPPGQGITHYAVPTGADTLFPILPNRGLGFADATDGLSNTLMVVESLGSNLNWMAPIDVPVGGGGPGAFGSVHRGGFNAALGDGSVRFIRSDLNPATLEALLTRGKNDQVRD